MSTRFRLRHVNNMKKNIILSISALTLLVLAPLTAARAHFYSYYGLGSRATAMGGAYTALANDSSAAYYNPAALSSCGGGRLELVSFGTVSNLDVGFQGNFWEEKAREWGLDTIDQLEEKVAGVNELMAGGFGIAMPLWKTPLLRNIYYGMQAHFPFPDYAVRFMFIDNSDPMALEYTNIAHKFSVVLGTAFDVTGIFNSLADKDIPKFSFGFGLIAFVDGEGIMRVGPTRVDLALPYDFVITAGLYTQPFEYFYSDVLESIKIGVAYRPGLRLDLSFDLNMMGLEGSFASYDLYTPTQWSFSVGFNPFEKLTVGYELGLYRWSEFRPSYIEMAEEDPLRAIFPPFDFDTFTTNDIWVNRFGAEYTLGKSYNVRGGYYYRPSPLPDLPDPEGVTNLLDSDNHVFSLGFGFLFKESIAVDLHAQFRYLVDRTIRKDDGSSRSFGGNVWNLGFTMSRCFEE